MKPVKPPPGPRYEDRAAYPTKSCRYRYRPSACQAPDNGDDTGASRLLQKIEDDRADLEKVGISVDDRMAELSPNISDLAHASELILLTLSACLAP